MNWRLSLAVFIIAFGSSFQFGYNIGVVNAPGSFIKEWIGESHLSLFGQTLDEQQETLAFSMAVSVFAIGGMVCNLLIIS